MGRLVGLLVTVGLMVYVFSFMYGPTGSTGGGGGSGTTAKSDTPRQISWTEFQQACGVAVQSNNAAVAQQRFSADFANRVVNWSGTILGYSGGADGQRIELRLRMNPPEPGLTADIVLSLPTEFNAALLKAGQSFSFTARLAGLGNSQKPHQLNFLGQ
ncbi:MAG: hypothetical protein HJJLKODD_01496 [Phycisphaerae bacterium]|nr:hypothetical protein [Phycisphaerae bacterium]